MAAALAALAPLSPHSACQGVVLGALGELACDPQGQVRARVCTPAHAMHGGDMARACAHVCTIVTLGLPMRTKGGRAGRPVCYLCVGFPHAVPAVRDHPALEWHAWGGGMRVCVRGRVCVQMTPVFSFTFLQGGLGAATPGVACKRACMREPVQQSV